LGQVPASILFVCTGNTCRSPMAAALCTSLITKYYPHYDGQIQINSAGCSAGDGDLASREAIAVLTGKNLALESHRARRINQQLLADTDLIITMGEGHRNYIITKWPEFQTRIYTLRELAKEYGDVSDPFGQDHIVYQKTAAELERLLLIMLEQVLGKPSSAPQEKSSDQPLSAKGTDL